jgi:hypothetical protein
MEETVSAGLQKVIRDVPLNTGYGELGASLTRNAGFEGWLEGGFRPAPNAAVFGRGFVNSADAGVMVGVRVEF